MSEAELLEIEKRLSLTKPGPWKAIIEGRDQTSGSSFIQTADYENSDIELIGASEADYDFIAFAREDIPKLISEIRRLKSGNHL